VVLTKRRGLVTITSEPTLTYRDSELRTNGNGTKPKHPPVVAADECVKNDPSNGLTYIALKCIVKHDTIAEMCSDLRSSVAPVNASKDAFDVLCNGIP
jgi:hypothetical protein